MILSTPVLLIQHLKRWRERKRLAETYEEIQNTLHKVNDLVFLYEKERSEISTKLREDYREVTETIRRLHLEDAGSFSLDMLSSEIPDNTWLPIFLEGLEEFCTRR